MQLKDTSFVPVITRDQAIAIARIFPHGSNWAKTDLPADATVSLFTGQSIGTPTRSPYYASDLKVWIVVVKNGFSFAGPVPTDPATTPRLYQNVASVIIDATTGEVIYGAIGGRLVN
ncbi:MAG: hypothetical protein PHU08_04630 [Dehalococcoidales bacterium]|nr:hypothetical protein [Dehalococcoidales bacterium]